MAHGTRRYVSSHSLPDDDATWDFYHLPLIRPRYAHHKKGSSHFTGEPCFYFQEEVVVIPASLCH